jgi:hypothetical protein
LQATTGTVLAYNHNIAVSNCIVACLHEYHCRLAMDHCKLTPNRYNQDTIHCFSTMIHFIIAMTFSQATMVRLQYDVITNGLDMAQFLPFMTKYHKEMDRIQQTMIQYSATSIHFYTDMIRCMFSKTFL